jgi:putative two-component system response regulator
VTGTPPFQQAKIIVVDDQPTNVMLLERLLVRWGYANVFGTTSSSDFMALCESIHPDLVLLDLHMPEPDGFELLRQLRGGSEKTVPVPVLVLTADVTVEARRRALALGASDFVTKPFDADEVGLRVGRVLETRHLELELQQQNTVLEHRVRSRTRDLEQARLEVLDRLATAAEYRDDSTHEHAQRVGRTAVALCRELGVREEEARVVGNAAPLHDIGKIGISDAILLKPGALTADERALMEAHTLIGAEILEGSASRVLQVAHDIVLSHHERWDGQGYPQALEGEAISLAARVTAVADVFDALTHRRPYKEPWSVDAALAEIRRESARHFDPGVVEAFGRIDHAQLLAPITRTDIPVDVLL